MEKTSENYFNNLVHKISDTKYVNFMVLGIICVIFLINVIPQIDNNIFTGNSDPATYYDNAEKRIAGDKDALGTYFSPGYPLILSIFMGIFGASVLKAKLLSLLLGLGALILVYFLTRELTNNEYISLIASFIFAIDPIVKFYSTNVYKEIVLVFFLVLFVYLLLLTVRKSNIYLYLGLGAIIGYIMYMNSWAIALIFAVFYPLALEWRKLNFKRIVEFSKKAVFSLVGLFGMMLFLNLLFFMPDSGEGKPLYSVSNGGLLMYLGNNPTDEANVAFTSAYTNKSWEPFQEWLLVEHPEINYNEISSSTADLSKYGVKYVLNFWSENPGYLIKRVFKFFTSYWLYPNDEWAQRFIDNKSAVFNYLWIKWIFVLVGMIFTLTRGWDTAIKYGVIYYPIFLVTGVYALTIYLMRYKFYIVPFQIILAAVGIYVVVNTILKNVFKEVKKDKKKNVNE